MKIVRLILFFLGILTIAVGFYATRPQVVQFAIYHSSPTPDKVLSESTIATLQGLRIKIFFLGVMLILSSILVGYVVLFQGSIVRKIESEHLIERAVSFIGRLLGLIYRIGTNEKLLWCLLILIFMSLPLPNIFSSPEGGFHLEGIDLQPAKNLARHGVYATLTAEGFDVYTYKITAGPGILLPNALIFGLFGINLYYSRALYLAFSIATLIIFYRISRDLYGKKVALLAVFISVPMMLPSYPAKAEYTSGFFYFLVGAFFWFKSIDTKKDIYLFISGLFWGLSFQTKWLFLFAIIAVIITCIILRLSKNGLGSKYYLIPSSMVFLVTIAWFIFRVFNVGLRLELIHLLKFWKEHGHRAIGTGTFGGGNSIFEIVRPIASLAQVDFWYNQVFLIIPAILYVIILIRKSKWTDHKNLFFVSFTLIWFTWWLQFNYDLAELHLSIVIFMSQLFIAKLLYDVWDYSSAYKTGFLNLENNRESQKATVFYLLRVVIICVVLGKTLLPLFWMAGALHNYNLTLTKPTKEMMVYIKNNTEKNAVFSGWLWSMPWYVDLDNTGDHIIKDRATYRPEQREAVQEYFIVSPEWPLVKTTDGWPDVSSDDRYTIEQNEIRKKFLEEQCTLVKTFGDKHKWLLYRINNDKLTQGMHQYKAF